jgi:hypothetical protein
MSSAAAPTALRGGAGACVAAVAPLAALLLAGLRGGLRSGLLRSGEVLRSVELP